MEFLCNKPHCGFLNENSDNELVRNTGAPQGCVISPVLVSVRRLHNAEVVSPTIIISILKFADGIINNENKISYRSEVYKFFQWCTTNYLQLNLIKQDGMQTVEEK